MKTKTYEVELEDGRMFDVDVDEPSTLTDHIKNFSFGGFTGMGGELRFADAEAVNDDMFLGHPAFAQAQASAVNDRLVNLASSTTQMVEMYNQGKLKYTPLMADAHFFLDKVGVSDDVAQYARAIRENLDVNMSKFSQEEQDLFSKTVYDLTGATTDLMISIGLSTIFGPAGAGVTSLMYGAVQKADTYNKAVAKGMDEDVANAVSDLTGLIEGGIEFTGNMLFTRQITGTKTFQRIINKIAAESMQEASQTGASMGVEKLFGVDNPTGLAIAKEMGYAAVLAAITSAPIASIHTSLENKGIIGKMREVGFTDKQIEKVTANIHKTGLSELKTLLIETFPEETARILAKQKAENVEGYTVPEVTDMSQVTNMADIMPVANEMVTEEVMIEPGTEQGEQLEFEAKPVDTVNEPKIVKDLKEITEKVNEYASTGQPVPTSLQKRFEAVRSSLESLGITDTGVPLTKKQVRQITKTQGEVKKYTEAQALRIGLTRISQASRVAFKAGKQDIMAIKSQIIEALKKLPKGSVSKFLTRLDNAKTEQNVYDVIDSIGKENDAALKKASIKHLQSLLNRFAKSESIDVRARETLNAIEDALDFTKTSDAKLERLMMLKTELEERVAAGETVGLTRELYSALILLNAQDVNALSQNDIESIIGDVQMLVDAGKMKVSTTRELHELKAQLIANQLAATVVPIVKRTDTLKAESERTFLDNFQKAFNVLWNTAVSYDIITQPMPFFFDRLDGGKNGQGAHMRLLYKPLNVKFQQSLVLRDMWSRNVIALVKKHKLDNDNFTRMGIYAILQRDGGDSIIDRYVSENIISKQLAEESNTLTDNEMEVYNAMRQSFDSMFPHIRNTMAETYNKPVKYTKNYFSFAADFSQVNNLDIQDMFENDFFNKPSKNYIPPFTKESKGKSTYVKLNTLDIYMAYVDKASYLVTVGSVLPTYANAVGSNTYGEAAGKNTQKLVSDWISLLARKGGDQYAKTWNNWQYKALSHIRTSTGFAHMGFKITSALLQPTALFNGAAYIGNWAFAGMTELMEPNARQFVLATLPKVKYGIVDDAAYLEFNNNKFTEAGMYVLKNLDGITRSAVALGAMMKWASENGTTIYNMTEEQTKQATQYAEEIVTKSQSSPYFIDAAPIVTNMGMLGKLLSQFQSYSFSMWNTVRHEMMTYGIRDKDFKKFANMLLWTLIAALAPSLIRKGYRAILNEVTGYNDKYDDNFMEQAVIDITGNIPFAAPFVSLFTYGSVPIPSINFMARTAKLASQRTSTDRSERKKLLRLTNYLLGYAGAPTMQIDEFLRRTL